jgi:prepilin-type N-terminal cleavage/methylation domain-containing protein
MKIFKLKILLPNHHPSAGFTLIELLVSIVIMGIISSSISYGLSLMISSNQTLGKEQNRRTEVSRALDLMVSDIKSANIEPVPANYTTTNTSIVGTPVLYLKPLSLATCPDNSKKVIVYSIQAQPATDKTALGPNVVYRYGLIPDTDGNYNCDEAVPSTPIADAISTGTMNPPTCSVSSATVDNSDFYNVGENGFYSCVSDKQVSVALFAKFSGSKIYGISQTTSSGDPVTISGTEITLCVVPDLIGRTGAGSSTVNQDITTANLRFYSINTASGGDTVLTQNPMAGSRIPCNKGLVSYTY